MFTKLISFVCVLTLALAATTYADDALVVGNWEGSFDHWNIRGGGIMLGFSATGGTLNGPAGVWEDWAGPTALKVVAPGGQWGSSIGLKLQGTTNEDLDIFGSPYPGLVPWFIENCQYNMLEIDVTRLAAEWVPSGTDPTSELCMIFNWGAYGVGGWDMVGTANSAWDGLADDTRTVIYDLAEVKANLIEAYNNPLDPTQETYCELVLYAWSTNYADPVIYYLDNARLTPEPATIALLGLGALSLIRRKR